MHKTPLTLLALSLCLATAGCSGDDSPDEPAKAADTQTETAAAKPRPAASTAGEVPTYEQVKALALEEPQAARFCAGKTDDSTIAVGLAKGETYTRLICGGNREVLDYVVGPEAVAKNFDEAVDASSFDLWKLGDDAYVSAANFGGAKGLAAAIKAECGCGELVKGGFGS